MIPPVTNFKRAKRLALLTIVAAISLGGRASLLAAGPAEPLVELESHIEWSAVKSSWTNARDGWVSKTESCPDAACVSAQLLALEAHMKSNAMNPKWESRRTAWAEEVHNAKTDAEVAKLLLEFEQSLGANAFDKDWKKLSAGWIAGLGVKESAPQQGESVNFPEDKPAFTVIVPEGWHVSRNNGSVAIASKLNALVLFQHIRDVHDDADAKTSLQSAAEQEGKMFEMKDSEVVARARPTEIGAFKGFVTEYKGKNKVDAPGFWQCFMFSTQKGDYDLATVYCSDEDDKTTVADRKAILGSIRPVKQ